MIRIVVGNPNRAAIEMPNGNIIQISTDNGSAIRLALELTDWTAVQERTDLLEANTEWIILDKITEVQNDKG